MIAKQFDPTKDNTDWKRVRHKTDEELIAAAEADEDNPPLTEAELATTHIVDPVSKESITIRPDAPILEWFRAQGQGYQTRINAVLRSYVEMRRPKVASTGRAPTNESWTSRAREGVALSTSSQ